MKSPSNIYLRILIALGSIAGYTIIFLMLYPMAGSATAALIVIPLAIIGWFLGVRGSLLFGILIVPLNIFLLRIEADAYANSFISNLIAGFAFTLIGMFVAWIRELLDRVHEQTRELLEEIEKRIQAERRLRHEALHDPLTNLANRRLFVDRLEHAIERNKRQYHDKFAVVYLDFDRFKIVNDSLGHDVGDQLLIALGQRLKASVRTIDTVARMGGDEFAILLEAYKSTDEVFMILKRLQENLTTPIEVSGNSLAMTASIGVVMNILAYELLGDIMRDADIAMYRAKISGKNSYKVFDIAMREDAADVLKLETGLRRALENKEFRIHYQPILSLKSRQITGFEALLRWEHPERGFLHPVDFLKSAEESGLIVPIGLWALCEACRQMKEWQMQFNIEPPLSISVNLSSRQFSQPDLAQQIEAILDETALPARSLLLELTETTLLIDIETAVAKIENLQTLSIGVEIDDFGSGYSSLGYLTSLPVNNLKIDRSFITSLGVSRSGLPIIRAILAMADSLNMKVIAEGIETLEQLNALLDLNCEYGQGFFFNAALDRDAAQELIKETFLARGL
jgi:diguanylate cyclase (GGDEF)-like protein